MLGFFKVTLSAQKFHSIVDISNQSPPFYGHVSVFVYYVSTMLSKDGSYFPLPLTSESIKINLLPLLHSH